MVVIKKGCQPMGGFEIPSFTFELTSTLRFLLSPPFEFVINQLVKLIDYQNIQQVGLKINMMKAYHMFYFMIPSYLPSSVIN